MSRNRSDRPLKPEEREIWRTVARTVKPLQPERMTALDLTVPMSVRQEEEPDEPKARIRVPEVPRAPARTLRPAERDNERRVRRGQVEIDAKLDLHGHTQTTARRTLLAYLSGAQARGHRTLLVVTGKGASARALDERRFQPWDPDGRELAGVLRRAFRGWMIEPEFTALVSGYASAHPRHGGSGAFYVMLRC